jgi:hypothetical protein
MVHLHQTLLKLGNAVLQDQYMIQAFQAVEYNQFARFKLKCASCQMERQYAALPGNALVSSLLAQQYFYVEVLMSKCMQCMHAQLAQMS